VSRSRRCGSITPPALAVCALLLGPTVVGCAPPTVEPRDATVADRAIGDASTPRDGGLTDAATDAAMPGDAQPPDDVPFRPHPMLAELPPGTALDLGEYTCADRMPQIADRCRTITDYSRFNYDPYHHRILMFGGGHAATGRTDIDSLGLDSLAWESLYPSMSCDEVLAESLDPRGFHIASGHPVARHTYDMTVIVEDDEGSGRLLLLSTEGFAGTCHPYNSPIRSVASFPLSEPSGTWSFGREFTLPWAYSAAAEFDPVSGMVIVVGSSRGAGDGGMWVYDPVADEVVSFVTEVRYAEIDSNLVYYPPNQTMYYIARGSPNHVWEVPLDREDWSRTRSRMLPSTGPAPSTGTTGYAYDPGTETIAGAVVDSVFHSYDPIADAWTAQPMEARSTDGAAIGTVVFHMLDYDPVDDVFLLIANGPDGRRTWAYRR
jgi:hypothetical protein